MHHAVQSRLLINTPQTQTYTSQWVWFILLWDIWAYFAQFYWIPKITLVYEGHSTAHSVVSNSNFCCLCLKWQIWWITQLFSKGVKTVTPNPCHRPLNISKLWRPSEQRVYKDTRQRQACCLSHTHMVPWLPFQTLQPFTICSG